MRRLRTGKTQLSEHNHLVSQAERISYTFSLRSFAVVGITVDSRLHCGELVEILRHGCDCELVFILFLASPTNFLEIS